MKKLGGPNCQLLTQTYLSVIDLDLFVYSRCFGYVMVHTLSGRLHDLCNTEDFVASCCGAVVVSSFLRGKSGIKRWVQTFLVVKGEKFTAE